MHSSDLVRKPGNSLNRNGSVLLVSALPEGKVIGEMCRFCDVGAVDVSVGRYL